MRCECCLIIVVGQVGSRQNGSVQGRAGRGRPGKPPTAGAWDVGGRTGGRKGGVEESGTDEGARGECRLSAVGEDVEEARGEVLECFLGAPDGGDEVAGLRDGWFLGGDGVVRDLTELEDLGPVGIELSLGLAGLLPPVDPSGECFPLEMAAAAAAAATVAAMMRSAFLLVELEPFIMSDSILLHARVSKANGLLLASNGG